jgi:hypothetical protein
VATADGSEYLVVGPVAAAVWGLARTTRDLDLVADAEDVVLAKLRWRLTTRSEVQRRDRVEIAAIHELDRDHLWAWADRLGIAADLAEVLSG